MRDRARTFIARWRPNTIAAFLSAVALIAWYVHRVETRAGDQAATIERITRTIDCTDDQACREFIERVARQVSGCSCGPGQRQGSERSNDVGSRSGTTASSPGGVSPGDGTDADGADDAPPTGTPPPSDSSPGGGEGSGGSPGGEQPGGEQPPGEQPGGEPPKPPADTGVSVGACVTRICVGANADVPGVTEHLPDVGVQVGPKGR